jgi:hypothetical protein
MFSLSDRLGVEIPAAHRPNEPNSGSLTVPEMTFEREQAISIYDNTRACTRMLVKRLAADQEVSAATPDPDGMLKDFSMLNDHIKFAIPAVAVILALTGCTKDQTAQVPASGVCNASAAQRLAGEVKPTDAAAMRLTGATIVRQIAPGDPVTHDLRNNRVTIETDPASGRVVGARCG